jgi:ATP-dependent protease ClpP protease subunit
MGMHSHILIHQISTGFFGKFRELKDELDTCKKLMKMLKKLYKTETSIPKDVLKDLMKRDIYLDAEECLKYRIVGGLL